MHMPFLVSLGFWVGCAVIFADSLCFFCRVVHRRKLSVLFAGSRHRCLASIGPGERVSQILTRSATRAAFVADKFCPGTQKVFLKIFRNVPESARRCNARSGTCRVTSDYVKLFSFGQTSALLSNWLDYCKQCRMKKLQEYLIFFKISSQFRYCRGSFMVFSVSMLPSFLKH